MKSNKTDTKQCEVVKVHPYEVMTIKELQQIEKEKFQKIDDAKQEWYEVRHYLFRKKMEKKGVLNDKTRRN